ncbi:tyrosine-type recombinase/integrase (plasmid) [Deinococcus sp. KNUC1210]|uniref:tyrosine-type recombinase/integrase n=1 Tax=Deinococcus sp. KNUC1210 TaxID=2917691 RepID=UPI001EEFD69F|nr:site-specific integrase [Deinococcus sp. KNUC1210]ULH17814.1 tyrosine-type recombinase/integrase [Deinococcus sp. KNUC1210]
MATSSLDIVAAHLSLVGRADRIARLDPDELRRRAVVACRDADEAELWAITEAFLITRGRKGARVSVRTLETYQDSLQTFVRWALPAGVSLLRPRAAEGFSFVRHLEDLKLMPSSVQVRLSGARTLYAALRWAGATDANPFADVKAARDPRASHEKRGPYTDAEVKTLLAAADPQEAVVVLLAADSGLRNTEMTDVRRSDLRLDEEHPHVQVRGKGRGGWSESAPLSGRGVAAIKHWLALAPADEEYLLTWRTRKSTRLRLLHLCERAGVRYEGREVHGLRHTAGTRTYQETGDIMEAKDLLRHRDITSTQVYVQYARRGKKAANRDW